MGVVWPKVAVLLQRLRRDRSPGDGGRRNCHLRATLPRLLSSSPELPRWAQAARGELNWFLLEINWSI